MNKPTVHNSTDSGLKVANAPKANPHNGATSYTKFEPRPAAADVIPVLEPKKEPIVEPTKPTPQKDAVNAPPVAAQGDDDLMSREKKS